MCLKPHSFDFSVRIIQWFPFSLDKPLWTRSWFLTTKWVLPIASLLACPPKPLALHQPLQGWEGGNVFSCFYFTLRNLKKFKEIKFKNFIRHFIFHWLWKHSCITGPWLKNYFYSNLNNRSFFEIVPGYLLGYHIRAFVLGLLPRWLLTTSTKLCKDCWYWEGDLIFTLRELMLEYK